MQARNPVFTTGTAAQIERLLQLGWYHSIALPDGTVIPGLQSIGQLSHRLAQFAIPADLSGRRVLDIGAWDGWFSFEMERRGASVVAVDSTRQERFLVARELLHSRVEYIVGDICKLTPKELGYFDFVLFFGVLYHVKHPLLALQNVCALTKDTAFIESYVTDDGSDLSAVPVMEFYETAELRGQFDNWIGPNTSCLLSLARAAGFARVTLQSVLANRAHVTANRQWIETEQSQPGPKILAVENSVTGNYRFSNDADDYVTFWLKYPEPLSADTVFPEIGGYGSRPVAIQSSDGDCWQVTCLLPPGLPKGWHDASVCVLSSRPSAPVRIGVDVEHVHEIDAEPPTNTGELSPKIEALTDGRTWTPNRISTGPGSCLSIWASGLPETQDLTLADVKIRLNGHDLPAIFLSAPDEQQLRQINALVPRAAEPGRATVVLIVRSATSAAVEAALI